MAESVPHHVLLRLRKLALLPDEARHCQFAVSITRLTILKSLCQNHEVADRFVIHLARKTIEKVALGESGSTHPATPAERNHHDMMVEAIDRMEAWRQTPSEKLRQTLYELLGRMRAEQNEHRNIPYGAVRLITDSKLLLVEYALESVLSHEREVGVWVYQTARHYAERYASRLGTGLIPESAPLVQDIVDFWLTEYGLTAESLALAPKARTDNSSSAESGTATDNSSPAESGTAIKIRKKKMLFTHRQGQFLAFIHLYRKLHRQGPAETDLVQFFRVTPPSVHGMIAKLEELGFIKRKPGVARSMQVAIPTKKIPELEDVAGPPW